MPLVTTNGLGCQRTKKAPVGGDRNLELSSSVAPTGATCNQYITRPVVVTTGRTSVGPIGPIGLTLTHSNASSNCELYRNKPCANRNPLQHKIFNSPGLGLAIKNSAVYFNELIQSKLCFRCCWGHLLVTVIDDIHLMESLRKLRLLLLEDVPKNHNLILVGQVELLASCFSHTMRYRVATSARLKVPHELAHGGPKLLS